MEHVADVMVRCEELFSISGGHGREALLGYIGVQPDWGSRCLLECVGSVEPDVEHCIMI